MYLEFYNLKEKPFSLTPDPTFLYYSNAHKRAMAFLKYGLQESKGFLQLTGPVGSGKTTLLRAILSQLDEETKTAYIINPSAPFPDLLRSILKDLEVSNIPPTRSKLELLDFFHDYLLGQMRRSRAVIVIFDEAQNLSLKNLEEIRMLSNFETTKEKLLQIVFVGQAELIKKLDLPELRQLKQRIQVRYHLAPLTLNEVREYITHRLTVAGSNGEITFTEEACSAIYDFSNGIPRLINSVCDVVLLVGYVSERKTFGRDIVEEALNEMGCSFRDEASDKDGEDESEPAKGHDTRGSSYPVSSTDDDRLLERDNTPTPSLPHSSDAAGSNQKGEKTRKSSFDDVSKPDKRQTNGDETSFRTCRATQSHVSTREYAPDKSNTAPLAPSKPDSLAVPQESFSDSHKDGEESRKKDCVSGATRDGGHCRTVVANLKSFFSAHLLEKRRSSPVKRTDENGSTRSKPATKKRGALLKWLPIDRRIGTTREAFVNSKITILFQDGAVAEGFSRNLDLKKTGFYFLPSKGQKKERKRFILFDKVSAIHIGDASRNKWENKTRRQSESPPKGRQIVVALKNGHVIEGITTRGFDPECRRFFVISFIGNGKVSWELIERSGTIGILTERFKEGIYTEEFENLEQFAGALPTDLTAGNQYEITGDLYLSLNDYASASQAYQRALEESPESEWLSLKASIAHFNEGIKNLRRNDYPAAIEAFTWAAGNEHLSEKAKAKIQLVENLLSC